MIGLNADGAVRFVRTTDLALFSLIVRAKCSCVFFLNLVNSTHSRLNCVTSHEINPLRRLKTGPFRFSAWIVEPTQHQHFQQASLCTATVSTSTNRRRLSLRFICHKEVVLFFSRPYHFLTRNKTIINQLINQSINQSIDRSITVSRMDQWHV